MCGLAGYITHKKAKLTRGQLAKREGVIKGLLMAMQERGTHSTGVGAVNKEFYCVCKKAVPARELVTTREFERVIKQRPQIFIGHTRYATVGAINDENAHPFVEGNILGAHNGHVSNWKDLNPEGNVDSQAIFSTLNEFDNNFEAFELLKGAFAITWVDLRNKNKLYLVRGDNPLSVVKVPEIQTYFWTSTLYALQSVVGSVFDTSNKTFWTPESNCVYEISTNFQIKKTKIKFAPRYESTGYPQYGTPYKGKYEDDDEEYPYSSRYGLNRKDEDEIGKKISEAVEIAQGTQKCLISAKSEVEEGEIVTLDMLEEAEKEDRERFERMEKLAQADIRKLKLQSEGDGCANCNRPFDFELEGGVYWNEINQVALCYDCAEEQEDYTNTFFIDIDWLTEMISELDYDDSLARKFYK